VQEENKENFRCKVLSYKHLGRGPAPKSRICNRKIPSTARFLFQLIMRRKRAGAVKGKEKPLPPSKKEGGPRKEEKGVGFMILPTSYLISYSDHSTIPYLTGFRSGFWLRRTKELIDPYYATRNRLPPVASSNFQPPQGRGSVIAILSIPFGTL